MFLSTLKRASALTVSTVLLAGVAANATTRETSRPSAIHTNTTATPYTEQVLSEGGTLAQPWIGNLMDIYGAPILDGTSFGRDEAAESGFPLAANKTLKNPQFVYAAIGTGGAQLDFVSQHSGVAGKSSSGIEDVDTLDGYSGTAGFTTPWAGVAASTTTSDDLHFAAGDAPIPLGPASSSSYVNFPFTDYADSLAAYNGGTDTTGKGYNASRGPAIVVPIIGTGISIILNTANLTIPSGGLQLTQDDLCGIFTGVYTNWNQTSANPGTQAITIVHRSDGSGTTFLFSYDMSQMCSAANPYTGPGKPVAAHYWGQPSNGKTQGVGTDSNVFGTAGPSGLYAGIPLDNNAPEVVWPATSVGASKSGGMLAAVNNSANAGYIGYISPSYVSQLTTGVATEANVENYAGNYEPANTMTVDASLGSSTTSAAQPAGYPAPNSTNILYWPFPTALTGDALVGYSYGYFYSCNAARLKDQVTAYVDLFKDIASTKIPSGASATVSDAAAHFWELDPLGSALKKNLATAVGDSKVAGSTGTIKGTYISPVDGFTKLKFSCTPV